MTDLVVQEPAFKRIVDAFSASDVETCAIIFTKSVGSPHYRLLGYDLDLPPAGAYSRRERDLVELDPTYVAGVAKRAAKSNCGLAFVHSHPGNQVPTFSAVDDDGEEHLKRFLVARLPGKAHVSVIVSRGGVVARELGGEQPVTVVSVGAHRREFSERRTIMSAEALSVADRQIRAFGLEGQQRISQLTYGIVGLGGMGSLVAQQLAHLGARKFLLIDPDTVDTSNLNRLAAAGLRDVGRFKTSVASRYIKEVVRGASIEEIREDCVRQRIARRLTEVDVLFGCTDSHGSRAIIQQIAYQYLIPCIDMGSVIVSNQREITHVQGRVQMLAPGLACLNCGGVLDPQQVRRDMMTEVERRSDPYILGDVDPAPAVISLNATVASLSVTMLLGAVAGLPTETRHILYDALKPSVRSIAVRPDPACFICSRFGVLATGDDSPLMARND